MGASVTSAMSLTPWMRVSSTLRNTAKPIPSASPTSSPSAMLSGMFGDAGESGNSAGCTVVTFTGAGAPSVVGASWVTTVGETLGDGVCDRGGGLGRRVGDGDADHHGVQRRGRRHASANSD